MTKEVDKSKCQSIIWNLLSMSIYPKSDLSSASFIREMEQLGRCTDFCSKPLSQLPSDYRSYLGEETYKRYVVLF
jgi:hypothetical protein